MIFWLSPKITGLIFLNWSFLNHWFLDQFFHMDVPISGQVVGQKADGATAGVEASGASQCATDLFSVTNPGGSTKKNPSICGTNTGEHSKKYFHYYDQRQNRILWNTLHVYCGAQIIILNLILI